MLENFSEVLKDEDILPNIKDAYTKEDGSIYTMPVKFGIPMIEGNKDIIAGITDLTTEADAAESQKDSYGKLKFFSSFPISPSWLIQGTIDNSTSAWMNEDGTLRRRCTERISGAGKQDLADSEGCDRRDKESLPDG